MSKRGGFNKKLREEEQQAIGAIYKQYIDTFQETSEIPCKTFVKSGTLYPERGKESSDKGQLYNPKPLIKYKKPPNQQTVNNPFPLIKKRVKRKSNLRSLGDELKLLQHERQTKEIKLIPKIECPLTINPEINDHESSTNLFVSNLNPAISENDLIQLFGSYGALASVKIMWPRNEEASKSANCGFVAFMSRADAERALNGLKSREDMRINWGKSVKLPTYPIHIPPELYKLYSPPPPSGLPFNAQPPHSRSLKSIDLSQTQVKVTIPFDRNQLMLIHRVIEFVIREGPQFEAFIINNESSNLNFKFITDYQSPEHTYYRWKLYSMLNGDQKNSWRMTPFRMYENGPIWIPPVAPNYKEGMPKQLISSNESQLSEAQATRLVTIIKNLTVARDSIGNAMVFCLNHANAIDDTLEIIGDSFRNLATKPLKKVARLYLLSDVLYNCKMKQVTSERVNGNDKEYYCDIFKELYLTLCNLSKNKDREVFKSKILKVLRAWLILKVFDLRLISRLENLFLYGSEIDEDDDNSLNDEPLDGANLLKRSLQNATSDCTIIDKKQKEPLKFFDMFNPTSYISSNTEKKKKKKK